MRLQQLKKHPFLDNYLRYIDNTETPKIMHIWAAIGAASACMARHVHLETGIGKVFANEFILLVGPPGTHKSTALNFVKNLLIDNSSVRLAPDDTGGQRQGLISALEGDTQLDKIRHDLSLDLQTAERSLSLTDIEETINSLNVSVSAADANHMFAAASEFGTFMGEPNAGMTRLLNKVYDGEDYHYKLKSEAKCLHDPLMTIVGCTTTTEIARILPSDAVGQGFMSRWIFVFASKRDRRIAEPQLDKQALVYLVEIYKWLSYTCSGTITQEPAARERLIELYMKGDVELNDSRFIYYAQRRHEHLLKLCMIFAATRKSMSVSLFDVELALTLLEATELTMPEALGEFGLSPIGAAKQKLLEFLQHTSEIVSDNILWTVMQRDMKFSDFRSAIEDLVVKKKVRRVTTATGSALVYIDDLSDVWDALNADIEEV